MSGRLAFAAVVVAVLAASFAAWLASAGESRSLGERAEDLASGLRCPTCTAVSVSASNSPMAQSMRVQIRHQLRAGRSPDQIRTWFVDRYGSQVLLDPEPTGLGLVLWVVPAMALAGGSLVFLTTWRRLRAAVPDPVSRSAVSPRRVGVAGLAVVAVGTAVPAVLWNAGEREAAAAAPSAQPGEVAPDWVSVAASLERQGAYGAAAEAYREALRQRPWSPAVRTRLAFVLLRDGRAQDALPLVRGLSKEPGPYRTEALLVLGLAQRAASVPGAADTLHRFLQTAPDHPAAAQVRRLLREAR